MLNIFYLAHIIYIKLTSFILPPTKCFTIFSHLVKASCCSVGNTNDFLEPHKNLCTTRFYDA
jgi:hypothetical protein